jgi:prepilin signal peptidase PulO-like enzyme (type II secretory pathway)
VVTESQKNSERREARCFLIEIIEIVVWFGRITLLATMSYRDLRQQIVLDHDIAWFAFFNTLPLLLSTTYPSISSLSLPNLAFANDTIAAEQTAEVFSSLPLWLAQLFYLALSSGGALFLLFTSLVMKRLSSREMIGAGDILFALTAGLGSDYTKSFRMVFLAFVLAMPASIIIKLARRERATIAFIPFLALSFLLVNMFPEASIWPV